MGILQGEQRNVAALFTLRPRGQKRYGKGVLVIVRNNPPLDGVAHSLPPLIVLIVDVPPWILVCSSITSSAWE